MKNVYLISCTKTKRKYSCSAEEMYSPSNLFRLSLNYALDNVSDKYSQIYILSANYYLLPLSQNISPYDKSLNSMTKSNAEQWGKIVYNQIKETFDINKTKFIVLGGENYIKPLGQFIEISNPIPKKYRTIGKRMKWLNDQLSEKIVFAKELRSVKKISEIPKNRPGWYKWWAPKEKVKLILNSPYINDNYFKEFLQYLTTRNINGKEYYYIYVGIAVKESIRDRLNWHINQHHTQSSIESGFLSTLRQTISSLVSCNQYDEKATNDFINSLLIEYHPINLDIKSEKAKKLIEDIEKNEIKNNILPLNIRDNKRDILKKYLKELSRIRKISKANTGNCDKIIEKCITMNYELKNANEKDISRLIDYKLKNIFQYADALSKVEIDKINNYVINKIPMQLKYYKIIYIDKRIIGCLLVENIENGVLLDEIYLEENYRNKGIGTSIIRKIISQNDIIYLWVYKLNEKAIYLYNKLGFKIKEETENRYYMRYDKLENDGHE